MDCGLETRWWSIELGGIGRGMQQVVAAAGAGKGELRLGALLHCVNVTTKSFETGLLRLVREPSPNLHFLNCKPVSPHNPHRHQKVSAVNFPKLDSYFL